MKLNLTLPTLPSQCAVCHLWANTRVCAACLSRFHTPEPRCQRCALAAPNGVKCCGACLIKPPIFDHALSAVHYHFPWDQLILQLKFNAALELVRPLSELIFSTHCAQDKPDPDILIPVPLSPQRLRERGFNQAWELAQRLEKKLKIKTSPHWVQRIKNSPHQINDTLARRQANVSGAFAVRPEHQAFLVGKKVAVVDDVMTTGATANEMARVLKAAGAASVEVWTVARTARQKNLK
jgi:ComF family protein